MRTGQARGPAPTGMLVGAWLDTPRSQPEAATGCNVNTHCHSERSRGIFQEPRIGRMRQIKDISTTLLMTQVPRTEESARHWAR
jgi:hypothetical protein